MGPVVGVKVIEFAGIGPAPFAAMVLADLGADVLRIDRADQVDPAASAGSHPDLLRRGRCSLGVDLKKPRASEVILRLAERADVLLEGFRPGVMERLGLGPDVCLARNPRLVYGRVTGWGQDGPLAQAAGHDIDYIALAGVLHAIGRPEEPPVPPLNLVGDFGGGGMLLVVGVLAALLERTRSNRGQVVDAAMVDGAALLMTMMHGLRHAGDWSDQRGANRLDGAAPFYDVYETRDGKYVALGAIEPKFYAEFLRRAGLDGATLPAQLDRERWPELKRRLATAFRQKTRDEWCALMDGTDACVAPVLSMGEAYDDPHNRARGTFVEVDGRLQPAPAPRFSRTPTATPSVPPHPGRHTDAALGDWGFSPTEIARLREGGTIA